METLNFAKAFTTIGYLVGLLSLLGALLWSATKTLKAGIQHWQQLHRVPCHRCVYFTGNYRLKCTVHPCTALTHEAIDCLDYVPETSSVQIAQTTQLQPASQPSCKATHRLQKR